MEVEIGDDQYHQNEEIEREEEVSLPKEGKVLAAEEGQVSSVPAPPWVSSPNIQVCMKPLGRSVPTLQYTIFSLLPSACLLPSLPPTSQTRQRPRLTSSGGSQVPIPARLPMVTSVLTAHSCGSRPVPTAVLTPPRLTSTRSAVSTAGC